MSIADLIANKLSTGLPHPGDQDNEPRTLLLPWFRRQPGMPDEVYQQQERLSGLSSKLVAEAIVHVIEADYDIVPKQPKELQEPQ
jgi:hypothetical protein